MPTKAPSDTRRCRHPGLERPGLRPEAARLGAGDLDFPAETGRRFDVCSISTVERARLSRRPRWLSWASLAWPGVEGGLGIAASALASSVAIDAFGLDSGIEALASVAVILAAAVLAGLGATPPSGPGGSTPRGRS